MQLKQIKITVCEACLNGEGQECHTPGCALFLHAVDLPIPPEMYEVLREWDEPEDLTQAPVVHAAQQPPVEQARQEERERIMREMVEPLIGALEDAYGWFDLEADWPTLSAARDGYMATIAAVRAAQQPMHQISQQFEPILGDDIREGQER